MRETKEIIKNSNLAKAYKGGDLEKDVCVLVIQLEGNKQKHALLGYATTRELIKEITARIEVDGNLDYKTVNGDI